jgi:WD40 repeat protein
MLNALQSLPNVRRITNIGTAPLNAVAVSPNGTTMATGDSTGKVVLSNVQSGEPIKTLTSGISSVLSIGFSPDGTKLAAGGQGNRGEFGPGRVALWSIDKEVVVPYDEFDGQWLGVKSLVFSPDSLTLAFAGGHKTAPIDHENPLGMDIVLWDVPDKSNRLLLRGHTNSVLSLAFSPDGNTLYSGGWFETFVWDIGRRTPRLKLGGATAIAVSPNGTRLATADDEATTLFDTKTGREVDKIVNDKSEFFAATVLAFNPSGDTLAVGGHIGQSGTSSAVIKLWSAKGQKPTAVLPANTGPINSLAFTSDSRMLVSASEDATAVIWYLGKSSHLKTSLEGHAGAARGVAFSADGNVVAAAGLTKRPDESAKILVWDVASGKVLETYATQAETILDVAFVERDRVIVAATDRGVMAWDRATGLESTSYSTHSASDEIAVSPDDKLLTIEVGGKLVSKAIEPAAIIQPFAEEVGASFGRPVFSPDGQLIAAPLSGPATDSVEQIDVASRQAIGRFESPDGLIADIAYAPTGRQIAGISLRGKVVLWDVDGTDPPVVLTGHTGGGSSIAFSPDGKTLVSGGQRELIIWDIERRSEIAKFTSAISGSGNISFAPDGRSVAAGVDNGSVDVWDIDAGSWRRQLCGLVGRDLTKEEWQIYLPGREPRPAC